MEKYTNKVLNIKLPSLNDEIMMNFSIGVIINPMVRQVTESEKIQFDATATHPLQTWDWGDFRANSRVEVVRLAEYQSEKLTSSFQITFHHLPFLPFTFGYCPKSSVPSPEVLRLVHVEAKKHRALMVKFEPNVLKENSVNKINKLSKSFSFVPGRPLFTRFTFWLDLTKSESDLFSLMKSKTRYNVRLAEKKGVEIVEDSSPQGFEEYWKLTEETTARQGFYAHDREYHTRLWATFGNGGFAHLLKAKYQGTTLATWILFVLNGVLYYPYGASSDKNREVMASNLLMWEAIKFGKSHRCHLFDMWGSTGPNPKPNDPWLGFHRFKEGFGADLVEFAGTYDLIIAPVLYWPYRLGEVVRWKILRLIKKLH